MSELADNLHRAISILDERGWIQTMGWPQKGKTGPVCLEGALAAALGLERDFTGDDMSTKDNEFFDTLHGSPEWAAVHREIYGEDATSDDMDRTSPKLYQWNDNPNRTPQQVRNLLDITARNADAES